MGCDLGVTKTHSRPHVSDDNPYSESQFKTLKYRPEFPDRFGSIEDARSFCQRFFPWYNHEHHHRSEEHTSELQSLRHLVCRLLLEKKKVYHNNRNVSCKEVRQKRSQEQPSRL